MLHPNAGLPETPKDNDTKSTEEIEAETFRRLSELNEKKQENSKMKRQAKKAAAAEPPPLPDRAGAPSAPAADSCGRKWVWDRRGSAAR